jgi:adenylate cyclase
MAISYINEGARYATRPLPEAGKLAEGWARRAVDIDPNDAEAQVTLGWTAGLVGNNDERLERSLLALRVNPNSVWAHAIRGTGLLDSGRPSEGRAALLAALRLDPHDPLSVHSLFHIGKSYYFERDYQNALEVLKRVISRHPEYPLTYRYLAATLGQLGHREEAHAALQQAMSIGAASFQLYNSTRAPWFRPEDHEHVLEGLRKAGWEG